MCVHAHSAMIARFASAHNCLVEYIRVDKTKEKARPPSAVEDDDERTHSQQHDAPPCHLRHSERKELANARIELVKMHAKITGLEQHLALATEAMEA